MSTDKTLADVQPGGRVRLGDQAERAPWRSMDTCPRDGTVVRLRWGEDHVSPGWWSAPVSPVQNNDGTWPSDTGGSPWAFIDFNNGSAFVNHAVDTEYGPTHWAAYTALSAQPSPGGQGEALASLPLYRLADDANGNRGLHRDDTGRWVKLQDIERALAARQPVEFERAIPTRRRESAVELLLQLGFVWNNQRWEDRRQPVGEPVFRDHPTHNVYRGSCGNLPCHCWADEDHIIGDEVKRYAAPPAQAVDHEVTDAMVDKAWNRFEAALHADDGDTPEDRVLSETIDQRDRYHEMADELAGHIARIIGVDIGEHSSANCPWQNAIEAAEVYQPAQAVDLGQFREAVEMAMEVPLNSVQRQSLQRLLALIDGQAVGNGN
ncbi:hypothetical protein [Stenotrophomonas muris]|uniref:hypothetical protein n=1 Tax=Stenotrophomonas muris TaxID=2963283 RepID=UPI00300EA2FE